MIYLFKVFLVVALPVFSLAGAVLVSFIAWSEAKDYTRARLAMRRIAAAASSERLRISTASSQNRSAESLRAA
jgi:CHASE3 domain sensor protein